ncbi:MAG TPA: ABC transporter substrate-binding protein [Kofleriaceae bacterium]|jgi:ABC-type branched-subunit amino acid transport system substrate-binding protein/tRNA A-37 threonylcarbamoyl transferase component Bud32|nr:ABC transporter substrate-binding protein [Kofleriaceae bacterium]
MLTLPDKSFASPEWLGKYRFLAEIGFGGMSEIYLTVTQGGLAGFQKLVALKLLRRDLAEDDEFRRMFLDEARLAARLSHPNVVQTYDVGEDRGRYYIAMEYLEGQTFERIRRARNSARLFPLELQVRMLSQVLCGLHYAHASPDYNDRPISIVHRDVTPSNVLITYDGQVKLIDFGIAKVLDWARHTQVGVRKGKARYMAPEQVSGMPLDRRADLYSVGVMLWETLAGKHIWSGLSESEVINRSGEIPPLPPESPAMLQQICRKAMSPRPGDRYPTAEALRADLDLFLSQHVTPSRERELGAAVAALFADERAAIRQLIDTQLKASRPGDRLPAFRDLRTGPPGAPSDTPVAANPYLGAAGSDAGAAVRNDAERNSEQLPTPAVYPPTSRRRMFAIVVGAALAGAAVALALTRGGSRPPGVPGVPDVPHPTAAALVRPAPPPAVVVRGVTDDTITLGMSAAFSGGSRELGNRMKLGLDTAFAAVNDAGGVAGRRLRLLALDDGYEGPRALANVQDLIDQRKVFAIIGDVGTPTTQQALPHALASRTIFFGAFTGSAILRHDPPDRYVFNFRASYEEETARMIDYLVDVKKVPDGGIVVFAQNDGYGDAGYDGATKMLRHKGHDDQLLRVGYERNTLDIDAAVARIAEYNDQASRIRHPVKAIIMVATYKAAARFIQRIRDRKLDALVLNVSFVGSNALAEELRELGPAYAQGVIVTQVVPHYESDATGVLRYRDALARYHPDQHPDFVSLEGFLVGQLFAEALRRTGRELDTERLVDTLEQLHSVDIGIGDGLGFSPSQHQASHKVWATQLDEHGAFRSIDIQ